MKNYIEIDAIEFKSATKVFGRKRLKLGRVLLAKLRYAVPASDLVIS